MSKDEWFYIDSAARKNKRKTDSNVFNDSGFNEKFNLLPAYIDDGYWIGGVQTTTLTGSDYSGCVENSDAFECQNAKYGSYSIVGNDLRIYFNTGETIKAILSEDTTSLLSSEQNMFDSDIQYISSAEIRIPEDI